LDIRTFIDYWNAITVIEARNKLVDLNVLITSNSNKQVVKKLVKELEKQAYPMRKSKGKKLSNKDLMDILSKR